jgi:hypothetical protein
MLIILDVVLYYIFIKIHMTYYLISESTLNDLKLRSVLILILKTKIKR